MDETTRDFDPYDIQERRNFIFELIASGKIIKSNDDVVEIFKELNYDISQATVNRDFSALKISKSENGVYALDAAIEKKRIDKALSELFALSESQIFSSTSFFAIASKEGYEALLAKKIRDAFSDKVLGTMLGDGIITIFTRNDDDSKSLCRDIESLMGKK